MKIQSTIVGLCALLTSCQLHSVKRSPSADQPREAEVSVTTYAQGNASFEARTVTAEARTVDPTLPEIRFDPNTRFHQVDGFGGALTHACVDNLMSLSKEKRHEVLTKVFSPRQGDGFSYLRVPVGTNDYGRENFTYADDEKKGLDGFTMEKDAPTLEILKEIREINPGLSIMLSTWTAPIWMKNNGKYNGGYLKPENRTLFAKYLVRTYLEYRKLGFTPKSLTILNEPHLPMRPGYGWMWPTMLLGPIESMGTTKEARHLAMAQLEADFAANILVPEFQREGTAPEIFLNDHNFDDAKWYHAVFARPEIRKSGFGMAYHCYVGHLTMATAFQKKYPGLKALNTECSSMVTKNPPADDFNWWMELQGISALRAGLSGTIGWNLCLNEKGGPTNPHAKVCGGKMCRGMFTVNSVTKDVTYNPDYQAMALLARAAPPGSTVVKTEEVNSRNSLNSVGFETPTGDYAVVIQNDSPNEHPVQVVNEAGEIFQLQVPKFSGTLVKWKKRLPASSN